MDLSQFEVDVEPNYVRITVKGKVFQLRLDCEVRCGAATAERAEATGKLTVTMPRVVKLRSALPEKVEGRKKKGAAGGGHQRYCNIGLNG